MTPTPNPTAEQILTDEWILQADRAKAMTGMDAIWFPDAGETLAALRARNLLSEGALSEESWEERRMRLRWPTPNHMRRTAGALNTISVARYGDILNHVADLCDGVTAAGVAPQEANGEQVADDDLPDEHLPNQAYKVGRKIAERGDFNGLDAATVFMRGAVYGVRKLAPLDPEKVAEVAEQAGDEWQTMFDQFMLGRGADPGPLYPFIARALCETYTEGKLT